MDSQGPVCVTSMLASTYAGQTTNSDFVMICHGNRIYLRVRSEELARSPRDLEEYLQLLKALHDENAVADEDEDDEASNHKDCKGPRTGHAYPQFRDWVLRKCTEELSRLPHHHWGERPTLADWINPPTWSFILSVSEEGRFTLINQGGSMQSPLPSLGIVFRDEHHTGPWPSFEPSQVWLEPDHSPRDPDPERKPSLRRCPTKVRTSDGRMYFFKPYEDKKLDPAVYDLERLDRSKKELANYAKLCETPDLDELRICRLHGIVRDTSTTTLYGLLLTYIEEGHFTLQWSICSEPRALCEKWARQVEGAVHALHQQGLIWSNASRDNVLIDCREDAWLINVGGGRNYDRDEPEFAGTVEGDLYGVRKIVQYCLNERDAEKSVDTATAFDEHSAA